MHRAPAATIEASNERGPQDPRRRRLLAALAALGAGSRAGIGAAEQLLPRIGVITMGAAADRPDGGERADFIRGVLADHGWVEGRTVRLELRNGRGDSTRFPQIARELAQLRVDVIWVDSAPALRAAYAVTRTIPIVAQDFTSDPIAAGYARSWAKPGGNVTGVFLDAPEISGKWLELLKAVRPGLSRVAVIWDPVAGNTHVTALQALALSFNVRIQVVEVRVPQDIDAAERRLKGKADALVTLPSPMMVPENARLVRVATRLRLPATSMFRQFADAGGLLAYGPERRSAADSVATHVTAVLRGLSPGDVPLERPGKFNFVVNLKTARALGLDVPDQLLARADAIIR